MLLALLALLVVYLAISVPNDWFPAAAPKAFAAKGLALARGTGQLVDEELRVTTADSTGLTVVSLVADLKSDDYAAIAWIAMDMPEKGIVRMLWRTDQETDKANRIHDAMQTARW